MDNKLLGTKFYIPSWRANGVARFDLIEKLNECLCTGKRLVLLSAPTGYGKTTLLAEWLAQNQKLKQAESADENCLIKNIRFGWLTLDEDDNDVHHFLMYLVTAFMRIDETIGVVSESLLQAPAGTQIAGERVIHALINELEESAIFYCLILDDYSQIHNASIHELMRYLIQHLPQNVRIILATRSDPPLNLSVLRVRNQLVELRQMDLRFTREETGVFFNNIHQFHIDAEDLDILDQRTEGWIAGLHLLALSLEGRKDSRDFIRDFSGSNRYVLEYLIEEVLMRQAPYVQHFLLATSILDRMCASLCNTLTGRSDSQEMFDLLEQHNLFIVSLDQRREWYRYHHLFAEFLRSRLLQKESTDASLDRGHLIEKASDWFEMQGYIEEALKLLMEIGHYERAAALIERHALNAILTEESHTIFRCFNLLPEKLFFSRPRLGLSYAWYLFISGQKESAQEILDKLQGQPEKTDVDLSIEMDSLRTIMTMMNGDINDNIECAQQVLEKISRENFYLRAIILANLGLAYDMQGDIQAATRLYQQAADVSREGNALVLHLLSVVQLADLKVLQAHLYDAEKIYLQALDLGTKNGRLLPITSMALAGLGRLYYEWNDLDQAAYYLEKCIDVGLRWESADMRASGSIYLALVEFARDKRQVALHLIDDAEEAIRQDLVSGPTADITLAYIMRLWLMSGHAENTRQWQADFSGQRREKAINLEQIDETTRYRLFLAQHAPEKVLSSIEKRIIQAERLGQTGNLIEDFLLLALALDMQGKTQQAVITLLRALSLGEEQGYCRIFLDEGYPMQSLLFKAKARGILTEYIQRLLDIFDEELQGIPPAGMLASGLSEREIEVMQLMADGLSNPEIAGRLFVSLSTVKTHVHNIYNKMGTRSRVKAIQLGRESGIIR